MIKKFENFLSEHLEEEKVKFKIYSNLIGKHIVEKYNKTSKFYKLNENRINVNIYDNKETITDIHLKLSLNFCLKDALSLISTSDDYFKILTNSKKIIEEVVNIIKDLDLSCAISDTGSTSDFIIELNETYFEKHKDLINSLNSINKYKL